MAQGKEYYAFISYKREDEKWAKWLQNKLEHYRFPSNLNGLTDLPKSIRPTFRDVTDLTPEPLEKAINNALINSQWLIIVCSPRSAKSPWVCKEAQTFIDLGRADHIIPFVIEGSPFSNNPATECFPEALLNLTGSCELLAANINEMGRDAAAIKVVARMFDLRFDALWQRYEREQRRRKKITVGIIGLIAVIALIVAGIIMFQNFLLIEKDSNLKRNQARAVAEKAEKLIDEGDDYTAIRILMEVLPDGVFNRTVEPEVEGALRKAWNNNSAILRGHTDMVKSAVYDSRGQTILSASADGTIKLWDAQNGCLKKTIPISRVNCAYFSTDDSRIVTTSLNGTVQVWNAVSGDLEKTLGVHSWVPALFWRDNDHLLVLDTLIRIMDIGRNQEKTICSFVPETRLCQLNLSDDGKYIVASSMDNRIYLWDVESGEKRVIGEHEKRITKTALSKDGKTCFSSSEDGTIKIWDWEASLCKKVSFTEDSSWIATMDVYDDELIAFVHNKDVNIYNNSSDDIVFSHAISELSGFVSSICWNRDGDQLVVACSSGILIVVNIWSSLRLGTIDLGEVTYVQFSPDEEEMALIIDDSIIAFFDGDTITKTWNTCSNELFSIDYSPDGNNLMSVFKEGFIQIWDCSSGIIKKQIRIHHGHLFEACYSPDGTKIASSSEDGVVCFWDVNTGKCLGEIQTGLSKTLSEACVSFNSQGDKIAIGCHDGSIKIWDVDKLTLLDSIGTHFIAIQKIKYSPDDKYIVTGAGDFVKIWNINEKQEKILLGHEMSITSLGFHPNGRYLISTSFDNTFIWDVESGTMVGKLISNDDLQLQGARCASFCMGGSAIMSLSFLGRVHLWFFPTVDDLIDLTREYFSDRQLTPEERRKYYLE